MAEVPQYLRRIRDTHTHTCMCTQNSLLFFREEANFLWLWRIWRKWHYVFHHRKKKKKCINKDPIVLAAVSWTEIALHVAIAEVKHTQNPSGTVGRWSLHGYGVPQVLSAWRSACVPWASPLIANTLTHLFCLGGFPGHEEVIILCMCILHVGSQWLT